MRSMLRTHSRPPLVFSEQRRSDRPDFFSRSTALFGSFFGLVPLLVFLSLPDFLLSLRLLFNFKESPPYLSDRR